MNQLNINKKETDNLRKLFESVDNDKNGTLSFSEIKEIMRQNLTSEDYSAFSQLLKRFDSDRNKRIDYSEFLNLTVEHKLLLSRENLEITFKKLDIDNSGYLTTDELRKTFEIGGSQKSETFWKDFVKSMDENGDDKVTLDEFIKTMEKLINT